MSLGPMIGFVTTTDPARAKAFYSDVMGFRFVAEDDYALVFDARGTMIRIAKTQSFTPAPHTVLGWQVADIRASVRELAARGAVFEQYNLPFMKQDELGVWDVPGGGAAVAWFKDPDGNTLSLSQHGETAR